MNELNRKDGGTGVFVSLVLVIAVAVVGVFIGMVVVAHVLKKRTIKEPV